MASLLLVTGVLLLAHETFSALPAEHPVTEDTRFSVDKISLSMEPSSDVVRGTNVTLRCQVEISTDLAVPRHYTIYGGYTPIYSETTTSSGAVLHLLPEVQMSDKYTCEVVILGKKVSSELTPLVVRGATPLLHLDKDEVTEGENLTARCTAPGETGLFLFLFYDSERKKHQYTKTNQAEFTFNWPTAGNHTIHCNYTIEGRDIKSFDSRKVPVHVTALNIRPVLKISPEDEPYEGDQLTLSCSFVTSLTDIENVYLELRNGSRFLTKGFSRITHSITVTSPESMEFTCRLNIRNVWKSTQMLISVRELFTTPILKVSLGEIYHGDPMTLTCKSESFAPERIREEDLTYSLLPGTSVISEQVVGVFHVQAPAFDSNYTCVATARNISKPSRALRIRPKVHVSTPMISVVEPPVQGRPFRILCNSDSGSLPINYTLLKDRMPVDNFTVHLPHQQALFTVTISSAEEMKLFSCEAQNSDRLQHLSSPLNATLIIPLSHPTLTVIPVESEISEGDDLYLICGVQGSPPVTFKWYHNERDGVLNTITSDKNTSHHELQAVTAGQSGTYLCEAVNYANNVVRSAPVNINVRLALWKKAVIGSSLVVGVTSIVAVAVCYFRCKQANRPNVSVSVWSERPPEAAVESRVPSREPDVEYTEVVHPRPTEPTRAPRRKGTDTVYSELQKSPRGAARQGYEAVEYVELNRSDRPVSECFLPDVASIQDFPVPVD